MFEKNVFSSLATIMEDGSPHVVPVWVGIDGEYIITAGGIEHVRHANMKRDPRVALTISAPENPYEVYLVRGKVVSMSKQGGERISRPRGPTKMGSTRIPIPKEKGTISNSDSAGEDYRYFFSHSRWRRHKIS